MREEKEKNAAAQSAHISIKVILLRRFIRRFRTSFKLYLPTDLAASLDSGLSLSHKQQFFASTKLDFKNSCLAGSGGGGGGGGNISSSGPASTAGSQNLCLSANSPSAEQFIFPAIFSRQLNFSASGGGGGGSVGSGGGGVGIGGSGSVTCGSTTNSSNAQSKLMEDLRPNLVGGLLGLQQGLLDDHALAAHGNLQHSAHQESKFMSLQDNRLMGITSHENRLLGLSQDLRSASSINNLDNSKTNVSSSASHQNRKCSSTPEDFSALYGGLSAAGLGDTSSHHHTPAHTPPSRLADHTITGTRHVFFYS